VKQLSKHPLYTTWVNMRARCRNPNNSNYKYYGGRGIKVCDRWDIFQNFLDDMGQRPRGTTLDRINNEGNYEPENCRWETQRVQLNNTRSNRKVCYNGAQRTIAQWSRATGIKYTTLRQRLYVYKWPTGKALGE